ncbi:MAG: hypothetical protein IH797_05600, partial [Chloroflexi bacterium]|nr:hypothetical protein [Chloroflexota bacterium]
MAGDGHPTWHGESNDFGPNDGVARRRRFPSRGFFIGMGAAVMFAILLAVMGAIAAGSPSEGLVPDADYTTDLTAESPEAEATSSTVQNPTTIASSWSAGPTPVSPAPAPPAASDAVRLAGEADEAYGVRIVVDGQDWGADDAAQTANVQAVISAIDRLPATVISAVVAHVNGPLTFVSNDQGSTLDGWQPYGGQPMTYYTNSDQSIAGYQASNQVVLSVGATSMSIGHEIFHAYQFRSVGPDQYALALLQPEVRSFMEAVGWRQIGSDEEVRQTVNQPWSALDSLYAYEGRALTYTTAGGSTGTITAPNPVEAFAITGSMYYTPPAWMA